jgi:hypothetical protein
VWAAPPVSEVYRFAVEDGVLRGFRGVDWMQIIVNASN